MEGKKAVVRVAAIFFASDEAEWVSGEQMLVAGGIKGSSDLFWWLQEVNPMPKGQS